MNTLDQIYENQNLEHNFFSRKASIEARKTLIKGAFGVGKTSLCLEFLKGFENPLYINLKDFRILNFDFLFDLNDFIREKNIDILAMNFGDYILDEKLTQFLENIDLPCVFISNLLSFKGFEILNLNPLDWEEFIAFFNRNLSEGALFNEFLKLGNSPKSALLGSNQENLSLSLQANFTPIELEILHLITDKISKTFSAYEIFKILKQNEKISKDKFYKELDFLEKKAVLNFVTNIENKAAQKIPYFSDFALINLLNFKKDPKKIIANMVFCELLKFDEPINYDENFDFLIKKLDSGIIVAPFLDSKLAFLKAKKIINLSKANCPKNIIIISNAKELNEAYEGVRIKILPFWHWAGGLNS